MKLLLFVLYLVVEVSAFVGLAYLVGLPWTILATIATVVIGFWLLARRGASVVADLRRTARGELRPTSSLGDTALLAVSTALMLIPGLVTTVAGILLLIKPVRVALRPVVAAIGARRMARAVDGSRVGYPGFGPTRVTVIDGEVVDPSAGTGPSVRSLR
ncbi:FxsA family protein [Williamsia sterculiae]|uniref:UPF0716 protein FxsA n=1 Tax=Williamsia sterculiae TaxID=1344003 RepID=A0A1N7ENS2_9NOCA|nr:FxsA family protein [Williamsia sterculiae]SIR89737.1 UPF0716 protein FxsA [Williamsia sterculiae]